jgi:phenylacetic acid degradation operon negative regulatory protein
MTDNRSMDLEGTAQPLLRAFRAQRPLRAGSLLITLFGDSIAPRGGEIALASLISLARPFALSERLVRTSIGRLAQEDWLEATRLGRLSYYRLTAHGRAEFAAATKRIYGSVAPEWSGIWTQVLLTQLSAEERDPLAHDLRWRGFGQLVPGVLVYPGDRLEEVERELAPHPARERVVVLHSRSASVPTALRLARGAWDLAELEQRYRRFTRQLEPVAAALERGTANAVTSFVIRTLLIHQYRRIHLRDPLLPPGLLPPNWTGSKAAELCRQLYLRVFAGAEQFLTAHATNRAGPLPAAGSETLERFGGLDRQARSGASSASYS